MTDCEKAERFVYISCVDEVRYSFVSHLSDALRRNGISSVFVDSGDLLSDEAQEKVERARVSVVVLPANRQVCLEKLEKVLNCQRNKEQVVIPVLYGDSILHGEWLSAMNLRGLSPVFQSRNDCSDSKLVEKIVRNVNEKLLYMGRIGMSWKLREIENMVNKQPLGIRGVGIWGMPGIGKTELAKAVFDQVSGGFDACCFIEDYDKAFHENRLFRILVEQLMKDQPANSGSITKKRLRRDKLMNKRVLVVLDDVRNPLLAESFLEDFEWFGPESRIIITSRDKQVFRLCRINQIYEVHGLTEKEALQLFLLCASLNDMGEQSLHEVAMEVIKYANGNPLALSIYGGALKGKETPKDMETAFLELKDRPPCKLVDAIKRTYDTLNDSEKNIFLDIACFFQGENVDYVMQLLEGCGFSPHVGIDSLIEKCLVAITENRVRMCNFTQDVGRYMITKGATVQIEKRSRLWEPQSIKDLLEDTEDTENGEPNVTVKFAQDTQELEAIFLDTSNLSFDIKPAAFENMLNLRLLKIYCSNPETHPVISFTRGFLHSLPGELRLFHWENYPLQSFPQKFDPRNLVEINMPYSQLKKLWGGTKNLETLKTIRLCHSRQLVDIDDILKAPSLERIDLQGCTNLQIFPPSGQLLHLRVVNLSGCAEIKNFPDVPPNIEKLHLQGTSIRSLPPSLVKPNRGELVNLLAELSGLSDALKLERLSSLEKSSSSSTDVGKLSCLELKNCSSLQSLPNMFHLEFLKVLDLSGCSELEIIQGFPQNLKELYLTGTAVREVPQLPQSLELLNAYGCASLESIRLDSTQLPMHYSFSNCFKLSPQVVNQFLVKALANAKHIPREHPQEFDKDLAFSFCAPTHPDQDSTIDLQPGSSVMIWLTPSWRSALVGFVMQVEVAFSKDYYPATGFGIKCICRWKNKEGGSHRIEKNLHCWAPGKAVLQDHMLVFCDVKMRPRTDEGNDPYILADLVVFEFYPVDNQSIRLDYSFTVERCGVYVITAATGNTSLESISPVLSLDPVELSDDETKDGASYDPTGNASLENISSALTFDSMDISCNPSEELIKASYDDLQEIDRALFRCVAYLFNDEDIHLVKVEPLVACIDLNVSSRLKVLAKKHLLRVSSNGVIRMLPMGKEILHRVSIGCSEEDSEKISVASSGCWKYDVFLSFSSQDVRKSFLSHLLKAFISKGITMFIDNEIFRRQAISPEVLQAIRESSILIVVFSRDYASSSWLLGELAEIAKSRKELSQIVIPVFYYVDPWHVKTQAGDFGRQFGQTCKKQTEDEKQRWCQALTNIADILGISFKNWDNEADMAETIANDVSSKLNITESEGFGEFVRIENHVSKLNILLSLESEEVRMVGIWGPSGIGKTDIARALYSRLAHRFQRTIFVDMSFVYRRPDYYGAKVDFQTQFLSEVLGREYFKVGMDHLCMVRDMLKEQRVLIILDDVDDQVRLLDVLVEQTEWFGSGSRIVVITQDIGLLKSYGIDKIYYVDLPSQKEALQMFCQSAFRQNYPPDGFMEIAVEVAEAVGNLPLGLIVLGSYLRGREITEWVDILTQIKDSLDGKMEMILRVAYDSLSDHDDKIIYLHIACLFNYDTVEYVTCLLSDSHLSVVCRLKSLAEKSFIHITENGYITMHHLQQNFGREIVRNESIYSPGKRQFLVDSEDILDVFQDNTGTESVLGISLDISELDRELYISERGFSGMTNLRFLKFYTNLGNKEVNVHLPHGLDYLCPKLRLLHWEAFPMRCMPSHFFPENLVVLAMEASKLEKLWNEAQPLRSLKCMSLRCSLNLREIPDLSHATSLEKLDLRGCSSLTELPSSIWNLHKLKDLDMGYCTHLMTLPTGINLESLHCLNLSGCSRLTDFPEISRSISDLYLDGTAIEEVPWWIENISRLSHLSMNGCNKLNKISPNISKLKFLVEVDFSNCESLTEDSWQNHPEEISTSVTTVNMSGNSFQRLPDTWTSIQPEDLIFHSCRNLVSLPTLPTSLFRLTANNCESLESLHGSFSYPQAAFQFINCFKLNHHARELILQSDCAYAILPGEELPAHFTHRAAGSVLTIYLPRSSLSKRFPSFKACIMIESRSGSFHFGLVWPFKGGSDKIYYSCCLTNTPSTRNHLIVFHCEFSPDDVNDSRAELNYSDVQFEFDCLDDKKEMIQIKECGIQLLEVSPSADESGKIFKPESGYDSEESDVEDIGSCKRIRVRIDD
ncbi:unnamed protein product [Brassica oleracea]|uniref:ADP-ribosyl cyclase/cyclic ADP-ribose hydrolase n=1 Tax=Brassica oleracea var. oleracea TaxID=109376 RepID=A0A0D3E6K1_BRAOL|nr:PREDICTED: disease resistance protein RRS1 [Brassica oleracea var. oleracea]